MRIYEFENYIQKGLGRAIQLLRKEPDKAPFREAVWNNAIHDPRYDSQCNNSRGYYIKALFDCFDDGDALLSDLFRVYGEGSGDPDDLWYYIENLEEMIQEHVEGADTALESLYRCLMKKLLTAPNPLTDGRDRERDDFYLAASTRYRLNHGVLCDLVRDGITLLKRSKRYNITDFAIFFNDEIRVSQTEEFQNALATLENEDPDFKSILESYINETNAFQQRRDAAKNETLPAPANWREAIDFVIKKGNPMFPVKKSLWQNLSKEDREEIARLVEEEPDQNRRTVLLSQLRRYGAEVLKDYPRDPSPLIAELERSAHVTYPFSYEKLLIRELSYVVSKIKHPNVRDAAMRWLPRYMEDPESIVYSNAVAAWITNYKPEDAKALETFVKSITDIDVLHAIGMDLLTNELIDESILIYMYENTPCSNCRNCFLTSILSRYGNCLDLPKHISCIRQEARLDCDYGTRMISKAQSFQKAPPC